MSSESSESEQESYSWIPWFVKLKGNEYFAQIESEFVNDSFNLTGLNQVVRYYDQALDMITDCEMGACARWLRVLPFSRVPLARSSLLSVCHCYSRCPLKFRCSVRRCVAARAWQSYFSAAQTRRSTTSSKT